VADENTIRIPLQTLVAEYVRVLEGIGMAPDRAALVARLIGDNQKDGVYSHGLNRFNSFLTSMSPDAPGVPINIHATPELVSSFGVMEQYDGCMGVGPYNAHFSMGRAIELAQEHGIGCVSLRNTNHWQVRCLLVLELSACYGL
jgi:3-dehydro-L-gulonate 2-dehydrogenase